MPLAVMKSTSLSTFNTVTNAQPLTNPIVTCRSRQLVVFAPFGEYRRSSFRAWMPYGLWTERLTRFCRTRRANLCLENTATSSVVGCTVTEKTNFHRRRGLGGRRVGLVLVVGVHVSTLNPGTEPDILDVWTGKFEPPEGDRKKEVCEDGEVVLIRPAEEDDGI